MMYYGVKNARRSQRSQSSRRGYFRAGAGQSATSATCTAPHDVDAHLVSSNAWCSFTLLATHQPRSWLKAEAPLNMAYIVVTPEVSHAPMS